MSALFPNLPAPYLAYELERYVVRRSDAFERSFGGADERDFVSGEFGLPMALAASGPGAAFADHVVCVVGRSSKEEMGGIYTQRHVAFVAHEQTLWDGAVRVFPSRSVRKDGRATVSNATISALAGGSRPKVATAVRFGDGERIEPNRQGNGGSFIPVLHVSAHYNGGAL